MKKTCPICGQRKAKRRCLRQNMDEICSLCCAGKRDAHCGDCLHYVEAQRYDSARERSAVVPSKDFIIELNPEVEEAVNAAMDLAEGGNVKSAWDTLTRLLREYPQDHMVCYGMGTLLAMKGEHTEAVRYFDLAIAIYPYLAEAHFNKAVACQKILDIAGAVRAYRKVVEVCEPNDTLVRRAQSFLVDIAKVIRRSDGVDLDSYLVSQEVFDRAFVFMEQGDWLRALTGFRASAAKNDRNAPTHGNLGLCLAKLGRKAEALAELDRAVEIDSCYEPAKINRVAVEQMEEGRPMEVAELKTVHFNRDEFLRHQGR